jgi:integrase
MITGRKLKTRYGEGTIYVLREATSSKPGKYKIRTGHGDEQRTRTVECENDTSAKQLARSFDLARRSATPSADGPRTVCELVNLWVRNGGGSKPWSSGTAVAHAYRVRVICASDLGSVRLVDLTRQMIDQQVAKWSSTRKAAGVGTLHRDIRQAIAWGEGYGWAGCNTARLTRGNAPSIPDSDQVQAIPVEQLQALVAAAIEHGGKIECLVRLAVATGARIGELLGITWDRTDLDSGTLTIDRQRSQADERLGADVFSLPKTRAGKRTLQLDPSTVTYLRTLYESLGRRDGSAKVIGFSRQSNATKVFRRLLGDHDYHFHQIRHSVASAMLAAGHPLPEVARQLGHKNASVTASTYAHYLPTRAPDVGSLLADLAGI